MSHRFGATSGRVLWGIVGQAFCCPNLPQGRALTLQNPGDWERYFDAWIECSKHRLEAGSAEDGPLKFLSAAAGSPFFPYLHA